MFIEHRITQAIIAGVKELYGADVAESQVQLQKTKKESSPSSGHLKRDLSKPPKSWATIW